MTTNGIRQAPAIKPLGRKAYGSIPHLPGSRLGPGDWSIEPSSAAILTVRARPGDRVIACEKLDGSCVAVARVEDAIVPLIRAGYRAEDSPHLPHRGFALWVRHHEGVFRDLLREGERSCAEWLQVAHGTRYNIVNDIDLFVAFDIIVPGNDRGLKVRRLPHDEQRERLGRAGLRAAAVVHDGPAISVPEALALLGPAGRHGALSSPEGLVYRLETDGAFNFIAKHVVAGKVDTLPPPDATGLPPELVYNGPAALRWTA